jgi:hypothetical protein
MDLKMRHKEMPNICHFEATRTYQGTHEQAAYTPCRRHQRYEKERSTLSTGCMFVASTGRARKCLGLVRDGLDQKRRAFHIANSLISRILM